MSTTKPLLTRRRFLRTVAIGSSVGVGVASLNRYFETGWTAETFVARAPDYTSELADLVSHGFRELGVSAEEVRGKRILLKPNLVEPDVSAAHVNTNPAVLYAAAVAFMRLGAQDVVIGEGPGHRRDTLLVLEDSGLLPVLREAGLRFHDLNDDASWTVANRGGLTDLGPLHVSAALNVDWIVSVAKLKTHHWTGMTGSMKNLFGVMPGIVYGWPKNTLHVAGLDESILDINRSISPSFAIIDGIIGMEGDGPILGEPRKAGVLVMGRNLPAVDATAARIIGIDPFEIGHLYRSSGWLGPIRERNIEQRGERISDVRVDFALRPDIPAHQGIRL